MSRRRCKIAQGVAWTPQRRCITSVVTPFEQPALVMYRRRGVQAKRCAILHLRLLPLFLLLPLRPLLLLAAAAAASAAATRCRCRSRRRRRRHRASLDRWYCLFLSRSLSLSLGLSVSVARALSLSLSISLPVRLLTRAACPTSGVGADSG